VPLATIVCAPRWGVGIAWRVEGEEGADAGAAPAGAGEVGRGGGAAGGRIGAADPPPPLAAPGEGRAPPSP
jgi:hypothetical protein